MSTYLKGFGSQSTKFDFNTKAQWSDIVLSKTFCLLVGQNVKHSVDIMILSSMLLANPLAYTS